MKSSDHTSPIAPEVSELLMVRINAYALAAAAAGVGLMAFTQPAEAEIVFTPANGTIPVNTLVSIDLNHDGAADAEFFLSTFAYHSFRASLSVTPLGGGGVVAAPPTDAYAAALFKGNSIGPGRSFAGQRAAMIRTSGFAKSSTFYHRSVKGLWSNVTNRYLGIRFTIEGATHYGWVRLTVSDTRRPVKATITGYAYESVADQPIKAGQLKDEASASAVLAPMAAPSLASLALGSSGLELWRREDSQLTVH
jgi:hypothetical protein